MVWCCVVVGKRYNCPGPGSCLPPCPHNHATPDQKHPNILALEISSLRVRMDMEHISNINVFLKLCEFWFQNQILFKRHSLEQCNFSGRLCPMLKEIACSLLPQKNFTSSEDQTMDGKVDRKQKVVQLKQTWSKVSHSAASLSSTVRNFFLVATAPSCCHQAQGKISRRERDVLKCFDSWETGQDLI